MKVKTDVTVVSRGLRWEVVITGYDRQAPDPRNDASDWDFYGYTDVEWMLVYGGREAPAGFYRDLPRDEELSLLDRLMPTVEKLIAEDDEP